MIAHAREVMPQEAVGFLAGADGKIRYMLPLPNVAGSRRFLVDPYAQYKAMRQFAAEKLEALAMYHSHPGGGVRPSRDDVRFFSHVPYMQLIIALARAHNPTVEIAAYAMRDDIVQDVAIDVIAD